MKNQFLSIPLLLTSATFLNIPLSFKITSGMNKHLNYVIHHQQEPYEWNDYVAVNYVKSWILPLNNLNNNNNNWSNQIMTSKKFAPNNKLKFNSIFDSQDFFSFLQYTTLTNMLIYYKDLYHKNEYYQYIHNVELEVEMIARFWGPEIANQKTAVLVMDIKIIKNGQIRFLRTVVNNFNLPDFKIKMPSQQFIDIIWSLKNSSQKITTNLDAQTVFDKLKKITSQTELKQELSNLGWAKIISHKIIPMFWIVNYKVLNYEAQSNAIAIEVIITNTTSNLKAHNIFVLKGFTDNSKVFMEQLHKIYNEFIRQNNLIDNKIINLKNNSIYRRYLPSDLPNFQKDTLLTINDLKSFNVDVIHPKLQNITIKSQIIEKNNEKGFIKILLIFSLKNHQMKIEICIYGFRKKIEQDNLEVHNLKSFLQDKYKDVRIPPNSDDKKLLPSEIHAELGGDNLTSDNLKRLGIEEVLTNKLLKLTNITYRIVDVNNGGGYIKIEVTMNKNNISTSFIFEVKGFTTESERNKNFNIR